MHAISSYHGNRPTDRTDYNTLCHSFASAHCNNNQIYIVPYSHNFRGLKFFLIMLMVIVQLVTAVPWTYWFQQKERALISS